MRLKKGIRKTILVLLFILLILCGYLLYDNYYNKKTIKEVKVVNKIDKYGYSLKENKPKKYKEMFKELKTILSKKEVDEKEYVNKLTEMFIYDFYSLNDKSAKTDIGGVDFIYEDILDNFLENAQDTYYKYIENNIYNNRTQSLPVVKDITIESVVQDIFKYGDKTDNEAYTVKVNWEYTSEEYDDYQKEATLIFIHDGIKLSLVELK